MDICPVLEPQCVAHQDQVDLLVSFHLDSVDAIDPCEEGFRVPFEMFVVVWQDLLHELLLALSHGLHDEPPVVAEEEEAPACSRGFSRREDLVAIVLWIQRLKKPLEVDSVDKSDALE